MKDLLRDIVIYVALTIVSLLTLQYGVAVCISAGSLLLTVLISAMCGFAVGFVTVSSVKVIYYDYKCL